MVEVSNPYNAHMHYGDKTKVLGVIEAPDYLPKRNWYSNSEANKLYDEMQHDIYQNARKTKIPPKGKFPTILKIILGGLLLAGVVVFRKDLTTFVKKIFKR